MVIIAIPIFNRSLVLKNGGAPLVLGHMGNNRASCVASGPGAARTPLI
jgi:hypothetical protein